MKRFPASAMKLRPNVAESEIVQEQLRKNPIDPESAQGKKRTAIRKQLDSDDEVRKDLSAYYAATTALDDCMGRLIGAVEKAGIADDTIIVFTSDHGDMVGSHRMAHKQEPLEESISIPFIVRYPKRIPKGTVTDALLSPMDIMPTLLSLAGVPCPKEVEGISLSEAAVGKRSDQQDALLIMKLVPGGNPWLSNAVTEWRGVRTKTHTYVKLQNAGPWLLFDNKKDPYQMKNLVNSPAHKKLRDEMEARLKVLLEKAHDPFHTEKIMEQVGRKKRK
jgi:arylsulfatase A-like enzyme